MTQNLQGPAASVLGLLEGEGGADCTVRVNGVGEGPPPPIPLNTEGQCETRERLLRLTRSHATGGTRINDRHTAISPTTQASATRSTTHKKTTSGRGGRVYLDSIYRVMDDSSLRLLEEEWRERMKEKRECGVAK